MILQLNQWTKRLYGKSWRLARLEAIERDEYKCVRCSTEVAEKGCHIHHRLPLAEGGVNHVDNLETLCVKCHKAEHPHMRYEL